MELSQQDLLKTYLEKSGLSRNDFSTKFGQKGVTRRALDSWLLPNTSSGFRTIPDNLLTKLSDELITYLDESLSNTSSLDYEVKQDMVNFNRNGTIVYFPDLWLQNGFYEVPESYHTALTAKEKEMLVYGRSYVQELSFYGVADPNYTIENSQVMKSAPTLNGDNMWFYISHHDTAKEAVAVFDNLLLTQHDAYLSMNTNIAKFKDGYFVLFIKLAPSWFNEPLIIYTSKNLTKMTSGEIVIDFWQKVIDKDGNSIKKPIMPIEE